MNEKKFVSDMILSFDEDMKLDCNGVSGLIDFYIAAGVRVFFANCLNSGMDSITSDERLELIRFTTNDVNERFPVALKMNY